MARVKTDERIVVAMAELLRRQGYAATGIKQVVETADAPIGSIYHHFGGGKRDVAAAALRQSGAAYGELIGLLLAPYDDPAEGIEAAFVAAAETIEQGGWLNMCPVGTVAGEVADAEPALREVADEVMSAWIDAGTALFAARGLTGADARSLMYAVVSALEGAFIVARTQRSTDPILAAGRAMGSYARALTSPARAGATSEPGEIRR
ncbi:TetR/AcrR family transcriptional regulator [Gordonia amicalis]|uniref:TetR/AcrR family transcriptional regulator n=1 Tax=Gordonia amicalis TaxID=89053 RepID=UPI000586EB26|nr:TetR/AcrR family transcriptional regulator [Gordonia amicalis]MBA5847975.1 TetR/AcrR family transcriptional regulator [Gordonia amicalis]MDJ0453742.1 TetR/AcrR family transcriptional regulator [Gordonia amicalis]MDV7076783.1 TetR/AcrR family transcriptional regulator [Gordonia amicalis]MDV7100370.1 TetR/AcrR family transcriptional regulator [Gordonia amicalis]MDV7173010.1 TetR/AcrR family transcriptional regulator [Gordonia amicalis]